MHVVASHLKAPDRQHAWITKLLPSLLILLILKVCFGFRSTSLVLKSAFNGTPDAWHTSLLSEISSNICLNRCSSLWIVRWEASGKGRKKADPWDWPQNPEAPKQDSESRMQRPKVVDDNCSQIAASYITFGISDSFFDLCNEGMQFTASESEHKHHSR